MGHGRYASVLSLMLALAYALTAFVALARMANPALASDVRDVQGFAAIIAGNLAFISLVIGIRLLTQPSNSAFLSATIWAVISLGFALGLTARGGAGLAFVAAGLGVLLAVASFLAWRDTWQG